MKSEDKQKARRPRRKKDRDAERVFEGLPTLDELERRYLIHVLEAVGGNRTRAAEALGVDRRSLYRMAERFGIDMNDDSASKAV